MHCFSRERTPTPTCLPTMNAAMFPKKFYQSVQSHLAHRACLLPALLCCLLDWSRPLPAAVQLVINNNDFGAGSLRQALANAANGDEIKFLTIGIIPVNSPLTVNKNVLIEGPGENLLQLDGSLQNSIFIIGPGATVQIFDLTIAHGFVTNANGGGIDNMGNLTLTRVEVMKCNAPFSAGGGIYNMGNLTLVQSIVIGNGALAGGGVADTGSGTLILDRAAIVANIAFVNVIVSPNLNGSGGGILKHAGSLLATNSTIADNFCTKGDGGGIAAFCYVRMESCTVASNNVSGVQLDQNSLNGR